MDQDTPAGTTSTTMFQHDRLDNPTQQVRLLRFLYPEIEDSPLHLELTTWSLSGFPQYKAISYTWGPIEMRTVHVNGHPFEVRTNCYYTLSQVRARHPESFIWVDSICINQLDVEEKSYQVAMMKDIYVHASLVLVCVGPHENGSELVAQMAADLEDIVLEAAEDEDEDIDTLDTNVIGPLYRKHWMQRVEQLTPGEALTLRRALIDFLERPYWRRVWIVQEVAAAQHELGVLCGCDRITWLGIYLLLELTEAGKSSHAPENLWSDIEPSWRYRPAAVSSLWYSAALESLDLDSALVNVDELECSDPRDRVYALLGLVDWDEDESAIVPDYSKSALELAVEVIELLDDFRNTVRILETLEVFSDGDEMRELHRSWLLGTRRKRDTNKPLGRSRFGGIRVHGQESEHKTTHLQVFDSTGELSDEQMPIPIKELLAKHSTTHSSEAPKYLAVGKNIVGLTCHATQPSDIVAYPKTPYTFSGIFLMLRPTTNPKTFDIIGQGFLFDPETCESLATIDASSMEEFLKDAHGSASLYVELTAEDAVLFAGHDMIESEDWKDYDAEKRFERLFVNSVRERKSAAYVKRDKADAWDGSENKFKFAVLEDMGRSGQYRRSY